MSTYHRCYKYCFVPYCKSTTIRTPEKLFITVPRKDPKRSKWLKIVRGENFSSNTAFYCCEDNFNMSDFENYEYVKLFKEKSRIQIKLIKDALPSKFDCQKTIPTNQLPFTPLDKMVCCWVPECNHNSVRDGCRMLTFTKDPKKREIWKKLLRAVREPGPNSRICGCHFPNAQRAYGPILPMPKKTKRLSGNSSSSSSDVPSTTSSPRSYKKKADKPETPYEPIPLGANIKTEEVHFDDDYIENPEESFENYEMENPPINAINNINDTLENHMYDKKPLIDIKLKYLEDEHKIKMKILNIEKKNAQIQNETLLIDLEMKKNELANKRLKTN